MAGYRREDPGRLAGHRPGRHLGYCQLDKEGAAPTWKTGYGFHPLAAWLANIRECPAMLLRPGNAGSNTFTDHKDVLAAAIRQVPADVWKPGTVQDGQAEDDKDVAEITGLMSRAGHRPDGLRWIARRVRPSRAPGHTGHCHPSRRQQQTDTRSEIGHQQIQQPAPEALND